MVQLLSKEFFSLGMFKGHNSFFVLKSLRKFSHLNN